MLYGAVGKVGLRASAAPFSPSQLFAQGEQGVWYDPSDFSTMFQDSAGTTPVTAVEQPVGRILDKSGRGNHATQSTPTSRPVLSAKVNLLLNSLLNGGVSGSPGTPPTSWTYATTGAPTVTFATDTEALSGNTVRVTLGTLERQLISQSISVAANTNYIFSVVVDVVVSSSVWNFVTWVSSPTGATLTWQVDGVTVPGGSAAPLGRHVLSAILTVGATAGTSFARFGAGVQGNTTGQDVVFRQIQLQTGSARSQYQWTNTATNYDTTGFPYYLRFDGTDDFLVTGTITPGIDKAQVFAGVRKLSDAVSATPVYYGTSATFSSNTGAFMINTPGSAGAATITLSARGTSTATASQSGLPSPITAVVAGSVDIAAPLTSIKINGGPANTSTATLGTGNFLDRPMFIGRQNTVNPFNGHLYSLIARFGANLSAATITQTETWVNGKTGAY